jgi:maltooligosyltrehalose trehalohydrolase
VQLDLHTSGEHAALHAFYRELIAARRSLPVLTDPAAAREVVPRESEQVAMTHAAGEEGEVLVILGFAAEPTRVSLPVPAGEWLKRLDAAEPRFAGDGSSMPVRVQSAGMIDLTIPASTVLLLERVR